MSRHTTNDVNWKQINYGSTTNMPRTRTNGFQSQNEATMFNMVFKNKINSVTKVKSFIQQQTLIAAEKDNKKRNIKTNQ